MTTSVAATPRTIQEPLSFAFGRLMGVWLFA